MSWIDDIDGRLGRLGAPRAADRAAAGGLTDEARKQLYARNRPAMMASERPLGRRADGTPMIDLTNAPSAMEEAAKRWAAKR